MIRKVSGCGYAFTHIDGLVLGVVCSRGPLPDFLLGVVLPVVHSKIGTLRNKRPGLMEVMELADENFVSWAQGPGGHASHLKACGGSSVRTLAGVIRRRPRPPTSPRPGSRSWS